jgi:hypothetical protein
MKKTLMSRFLYTLRRWLRYRKYCILCDGSGVRDHGSPCPSCDGTGREPVPFTLHDLLTWWSYDIVCWKRRRKKS